MASHNWPGGQRHIEPLYLREGAYELLVEFVQPTPAFQDADDLLPLRTGLQLRYEGPDTEGHLKDIPYDRMLLNYLARRKAMTR